MEGKTVLLATYGSLKRGFYNHRLLERAKFLRSDLWLEGVMYMRSGMYPMLFKPEDKPKEVAGKHFVELYEVPLSDYQYIEDMEIQSGYYVDEANFGSFKEYKTGTQKKAKIFLMKKDAPLFESDVRIAHYDLDTYNAFKAKRGF
jgi:gamma-glutamylcyclotransferase (GGCT)/AIG2-like uncharacterized protein YtfP